MQQQGNAHCSGPLQKQEGEKRNAGSVGLVIVGDIIFVVVAGMLVEALMEVISPHKEFMTKRLIFFSTQVLSPVL